MGNDWRGVPAISSSKIRGQSEGQVTSNFDKKKLKVTGCR